MYIQNRIAQAMTPAPQYFNPATKHSDSYYLAVLRALAEGVENGLTDRELAEFMNERGILSPVGKPWTSTAVSQALSKLRNYRDKPSRLHQAFLQLVVDGYLKPSDMLALFRQRKPCTM